MAIYNSFTIKRFSKSDEEMFLSNKIILPRSSSSCRIREDFQRPIVASLSLHTAEAFFVRKMRED